MEVLLNRGVNVDPNNFYKKKGGFYYEEKKEKDFSTVRN